MGETRKEFKARLVAAGMWGEYLHERENLKAAGVPAAEAHSRIFQRFKDCQPLPQDVVEHPAIRGVIYKTAEQIRREKGIPEPPDAPTRQEMRAAEAPEKLRGANQTAVVLDDFAEPSPPPPTGTSVPNRDLPSLPNADFAGRTASAREVVQWVFDNLHVSDVPATAAPSPGAWGLLQDCRRFPQLRQRFYEAVWVRLLPTKSELEEAEKFSDDGRAQIELLEKVARLSAEAQA
jgi:hypothetical protein